MTQMTSFSAPGGTAPPTQPGIPEANSSPVRECSNAAEAALETNTPWVEIILLSQKDRLSLRVSNPYTGVIAPDKIWTEGFSSKGEYRGIGLPSYQRILAGYPNAASSTSWARGVFIQELTVEENA